jgi:hypothetical protein
VYISGRPAASRTLDLTWRQRVAVRLAEFLRALHAVAPGDLSVAAPPLDRLDRLDTSKRRATTESQLTFLLSVGAIHDARPILTILDNSPDDDVMYEGLPARRWKTFWLNSTPIEDVRESTVPLFIAQGSRDDTTLSADLFTLEAIRQQPDRPVRYVVLQEGDHAFETLDHRSHVGALLDDFIRWALDGNRKTSLATMK